MKFVPFQILLVVLFLAPVARAGSEANGMDIAVRSGIDTDENARRKHDPAYAVDTSRHTIVFHLAAVSPHPSVRPLVKPVDAIAIAKDLSRLLVTLGFRPAGMDEKPEIVITVEYGRGWLPNPYSDDNRGKVHNNLTDSDPLEAWPLHEIFFSLASEMKRQNLEQEKLIIQVRAWRYTPDPKQKPQMAWMTTMFVDDPDNRDLNEIYQKLLAAGAPHFDRPIDREREVVINTAMPEGHVQVGTPEVVPDAKPK